MTPDWLRLFPNGPHRFRMALRAADAAGFWQPGPDAGAVLEERRRWLAAAPEFYTALVPEGAMIAEEALTQMAQWAQDPNLKAAGTDVVMAGGRVEPDWVLLSAEAGAQPRVVGGVVIFPSSWSLAEKVGKPLNEVHQPVPGLQASLGASLTAFFDKLPRGAQWERDNWGFSADAELNHHPSRPIAKLTSDAAMDRTWLRLERQFLARLPRTGGVLFGIRVTNHRLDLLAAVPGLAQRLADTLETMTPEVAHYKGLDEARDPLIRQLNSIAADGSDSVP
jgi:hypothetical protein